MSEPWRSFALGELCSMKYGRVPRPEELAAEGYPIFSGYRVVGCHTTYLYERPEIVVVARGVGGCGDVKMSPPRAYITNLAIVLQVTSPHVDQRFLFYRLAHAGLRALSTGAAQPQIIIADLRAHRVSLPALEVQRRIAHTLAAYDELIENNARRAAILAELAQEIYREWFVRLRFPGHERGALVDSALGPLPAGWAVAPFAQLADFVNGHAFSSRDWRAAGTPIVRIAELKHGISAKTSFYDGPALPARYRVDSGDVLFSWSADLDAYIWPHGPALLNQHLFNVVPRVGFSKIFLFHALKERMQEFRDRSQGTTMRHIKRSALDQVLLAVPPPRLRAQFEEHAEPIARAILGLEARSANLRRTRDLLAAKLLP